MPSVSSSLLLLPNEEPMLAPMQRDDALTLVAHGLGEMCAGRNLWPSALENMPLKTLQPARDGLNRPVCCLLLHP